jgi:LPS-assembly protein
MINKNKSYLFFTILFFYLNCSYSFADEFNFKASEILLIDNQKILKGINGVEITTDDNVTINANEFLYDKENLILNVKGDVRFTDRRNEIIIISQEMVYYKETDIIFVNEQSFTEVKNQYFITSKNLKYLRAKQQVESKNVVNIKDNFGNNLELDNYKFSLVDEIVRGKNVLLIDSENNKYFFNDGMFDLKNNELAGKDIKINFHNAIFNNPKNEPRLKGNSIYQDKKKTIISKGVFTTCKKRDGCPPWVISAKKIEHNKIKKTINYFDAWLKVYDIPVLYFPKFFHPDPTVKRQSGFLMPTFAQSNTLGSSVNVPYFYAPSSNRDFTFTPRLFSNKKLLLQTEFREVNKNSNHFVDFSFFNDINLFKSKSKKSHFFLNSEIELESSYFDEKIIEFNLEQTSNDTYLKAYKVESPLIKSNSSLKSFINFEGSKDDLLFESNLNVYEDLSVKTSDRYEFIYPNIKIKKKINTDLNNLGNLSFNFDGFQRKFNTNQHELSAINDLIFNSKAFYSDIGIKNNYDFLLKNVNFNSNKNNNKNTTENKIMSSLMFTSNFPMIKKNDKYNNFFNSIFSFRYSPNKTKNMKSEDRRMDLNNMYSFNRIGKNDTIEGGKSITVGTEYKKIKDETNQDIFTFGLAKVYRDTENPDLPENSTIGKKSSDVYANLEVKPNKFFDLSYNFSLDNNLDKLNYEFLKTEFKINNFVTSFEYLEDTSSIVNQSYIANKTKYFFNEDNSLSFSKRKNRKLNLTEYYNLIYEYKNDCLVAGIEYNKEYYSDGDLRPEENIFFSITITPFGKTNSPNLKK